MKKYKVYINFCAEIKVYINFCAEIWDEVEAESEEEARDIAYDMISEHTLYQSEIKVEEVK